MNHQPTTGVELQAHRPRQIPWGRWFLYASVVLILLAGLTYLWMRAYVTISVATDTTVLTTPLLADGYPDYVGYLDAQNAKGVLPEENAWIAILRCCGPEEINKEVRAEHYRRLGIAPLPEDALYFRSFYDTEGLKLEPESVLIASSVAAQLPWHTRFVRLAALNAEREANSALQDPPLDPANIPQVFLTMAEQAELTMRAMALAATDFAEDPDSASVQWDFEANDAAFSNYDNDDEANIQDLRPEALAKIKPVFATPEEEETWRRELFEETRRQLMDREEMIMSTRPWTRAECPFGSHWIATYSPQLDQLQKELRQRQKMYVPLVSKPGDRSMNAAYSIPSISLLRTLAMSYKYRANLYLAEQNVAAALDDLISVQQLGALLPQHPILLQELVGIAVEGIGFDHLVRLIQSPTLTDEQLAALDARLATIVHQFDMAECLDHGERLSSIGTLIGTVARGGEGYLGMPWELGGKQGQKLDPPWERRLVHWDAVLREMNGRFDAYRDAAKTQQFAQVEQIEQFYNAQPANRKDLEEYFKHPPWHLLPSTKTEVMKLKYSEFFAPNLFAGFSASRKGSIRRELVRVMLALERFRRANRDYPRALTELVPQYLSAVPTDPFDGQPIKFLRTPSGGYRAYSVWLNGVDDGGLPNMTSDGAYDDYKSNDWVVGSPDETPRGLSLEW